jgi:hypothetical protein
MQQLGERRHRLEALLDGVNRIHAVRHLALDGFEAWDQGAGYSF